MSTVEDVASWLAVSIEEAGERAGVPGGSFDADTTIVDGYSICASGC